MAHKKGLRVLKLTALYIYANFCHYAKLWCFICNHYSYLHNTEIGLKFHTPSERVFGDPVWPAGVLRIKITFKPMLHE